MGSMDLRHMQGYHRPAHTSPCIWRLHRLWITIANTRHYSPTNNTALIAANILRIRIQYEYRIRDPRRDIYIHGHITDAMIQGRDIQTMIEPYETKRWQIDRKLHTWQDAQEGAVPVAAMNIPRTHAGGCIIYCK